MQTMYDACLFDEDGFSIPLTPEEFIDFLSEKFEELKMERDLLQRQLSDIQAILNSSSEASLPPSSDLN